MSLGNRREEWGEQVSARRRKEGFGVEDTKNEAVEGMRGGAVFVEGGGGSWR